MISVGSKIKPTTLYRLVEGAVTKVSTDSLFGGKRVVLFGVPGAFTPTCSEKHLPGFVAKAAEIKSHGVDDIICVAVNDAFVMRSWGKQHEVGDNVLVLSDGNGDLAREMGLEVDLSHIGFSKRNKRFASVIADGEVKFLGVDESGFEQSSAEKVLEFLAKK
eukprot:c12316_g1_i1.p1 GENE.c12316_g1_i1~~c12316_g1_i1.p1  ORF type:complete len:162 (+),score=64.31 c12316_g1_i1:68-553(+)